MFERMVLLSRQMRPSTRSKSFWFCSWLRSSNMACSPSPRMPKSAPVYCTIRSGKIEKPTPPITIGASVNFFTLRMVWARSGRMSIRHVKCLLKSATKNKPLKYGKLMDQCEVYVGLAVQPIVFQVASYLPWLK